MTGVQDQRHGDRVGVDPVVGQLTPPPPLARGPYTERQQEILAGIETIILQEGFAHLSVGDLTARLHCSRRTLYELAESKDELVLIVLDRLLQRMGRQAHRTLRQVQDPAERVRAFMAAATMEIRSISLVFAEDIESHGPARRLFAAHYEFATSVLTSVIEDGIRQGAFRDVSALLVSQALDAAIARLQQPDVLRRLRTTEAEAFTEVLSVILDGLAVRPRR